jgi:hypothetical protein
MQNPLEAWTTARLVLLGLSCAALVIAAAVVIYASDLPIRDAKLGNSAALEWPLRPDRSAALVQSYAANGVTGDVLRGIVFDTVLLIPSYVALLMLLCFVVARALPSPLSDLGLTLGWGVLVAGGLDLIENTGMVAQLLLTWSFAAPLTGAVCRLKWMLILLAGTYAILGSIVGVLRRFVGV